MKVIALVTVLALAMPAVAVAQSMESKSKPEVDKGQAAHKASGIVKAADRGKGTVTLAHGPVPSLKWPAMTMSFAVKDKALLEKLPTNKKVDFEFVQQGKDYVITDVK